MMMQTSRKDTSNARTVITYGTFDLFHIGHLRLIQRLQTLGDRVIIGVSTDEFNAEKNKRCIIPYEQRAEIVANIKGVDRVIPEYAWEQKTEDIRHYEVDIFAIGDDWQGRFDHLETCCKVVYLPRTGGVSTTALKEIASGFDQSKLDQLREAIELVQLIAEELR